MIVTTGLEELELEKEDDDDTPEGIRVFEPPCVVLAAAAAAACAMRAACTAARLAAPGVIGIVEVIKGVDAACIPGEPRPTIDAREPPIPAPAPAPALALPPALLLLPLLKEAAERDPLPRPVHVTAGDPGREEDEENMGEGERKPFVPRADDPFWPLLLLPSKRAMGVPDGSSLGESSTVTASRGDVDGDAGATVAVGRLLPPNVDLAVIVGVELPVEDIADVCAEEAGAKAEARPLGLGLEDAM